MSATRQSRKVIVEAQADHLTSLTRAKPVNALSELIWNALDADADRVEIYVSENKLGGISDIEVRDNGNGIHSDEADSGFGKLGGSWKRQQKVTKNAKKKMHGREGKGRFKAFGLGERVAWDTVYRGPDGAMLQYSIEGDIKDLQTFSIGAPFAAPAGAVKGTRVKISNLVDRLGILSAEGSAPTFLAEAFAFYLRNYPATSIFFRGQRVDPNLVQKSLSTEELTSFIAKDGTEVTGHIDIVEWNFDKKDRKICLCDAEGYSLHEVDAGVRPGSEFNFTVYVRADFISKLHESNQLILENLDDDVRRILDGTRAKLRAHFRKRKAESASELVTQWKKEGSYPYAGDPANEVDRAVREVFDICAFNIHENLDSFREGQIKDREFALRMLKTALDENPESLKLILTEVLGLSKEKQSELADLLQFTTLSAIISASKMVTERLQVLAGLEALLFNQNTRQSLKERTQLHKLLENETWIFGEEFLLTSSDQNLNTVLEKHILKLRPAKRGKGKPVKRDDGTSAVIDLLLAREVPAYAQSRKEYLVVELKRPSEKIDLAVKGQIESYALTVSCDERFDTKNTYWNFVAVSNEMSSEAAQTINQKGKAFGFFHDAEHVKIGLATWSEIILASRTRLAAFKQHLDYTATQDEGLALLRRKYHKYLPDEDLKTG